MTQRARKKSQARRRGSKIDKRGTVFLSNALLIEQLGFKKGDTSSVAKRKDSIILRKIT